MKRQTEGGRREREDTKQVMVKPAEPILAPPSSPLTFSVIIPARYASTRLPGKPLLDIAGKPMVVRVAERVKASGAAQIIIATDHPDIMAAARNHGIGVCLTRADHPTGTDRIAEVVQARGYQQDDIVVNVQGDEPLIEPELIRRVAQELAAHPQAAIATAAHAIHDRDSFLNPNVVKVVVDRAGYALYFSRAPIPYPRDLYAQLPERLPQALPAYRHVGIYAYRVNFLQRYASLEPALIERCEALEQLRALWHGYRICVALIDAAPAAGVDTAQDLEAVRRAFDLAPGAR